MSASTAPPEEATVQEVTAQGATVQEATIQGATVQAQPSDSGRPPAPAQPSDDNAPSGASALSTPSGDSAPDTPDSAPPEKRRGADTRALTQVLFARLKEEEPGSAEHGRVRAALIEANLPLVRYAAARFRSRNEPMEDVVQVGTIGLINAIDRFDPDRGVQFPTFAMPTVVGEIKRYFRDNVRTVHVPRRLHELWVQVNSATEDLTTAFGRSPTTAEIAERLRITEEEVLSCIEAGRSYHATSLEAAQEGDGLPGLLDRLGYEDPALDGVEHRDLVRHLLVQLPEREQRILLLRYYSNLTQSQISAELGVSQMHVSRLLARSFARLRSANRIDA
ncbi:SigB/SigF/SigG family RNA polymerase sigma factor [Streptomyces sp. NPDC059786]|uniref:RNA polymerase sigma factor SigF n=1 Tax=Streptomyces sp. NPDC059786 TaxID=3346946 RepID=UPI003669B710